MTNTKICNTCKQELPVVNFGVNRVANSDNFHAGTITSYKGDCKPCLAIKAKAYRNANPGLWKKYRNNSGKQKDFPKEDRLLVSAIRDRISSAKQRDKKKGVLSTITVKGMYDLFKENEGKCALTGVEILIEKHSPLGLSIDKIEPSGNYTPDNVQWVCWAANRAKGDLTTNDFIDMCKMVTEKCRDYPKGVGTK